MWRTTVRGLLAHKLRLALSGLAIVLGVAFVSGTLIFTDTLSKTFTNLFESTAADVSVERATAFTTGIDSPGGSASYVPGALVEQVEGVEGVAAAEGYVQTEGVYVLDQDGKVLDTGGAPGECARWCALLSIPAESKMKRSGEPADERGRTDGRRARARRLRRLGRGLWHCRDRRGGGRRGCCGLACGPCCTGRRFRRRLGRRGRDRDH